MFKFSDLQLPVVQAPMAGGINTPELAAAVVQAGGLASFGFAYSSPEKIDADLTQTRNLLKQGGAASDGLSRINANFFVFEAVQLPAKEIVDEAIQDLKSLNFDAEFNLTIPQAPYFPDLEVLLEPIWRHRPGVLTFHFGLPPVSVMKKAHDLDICVGVTATSVREAQLIQDAGANFVVAQGIEAGGHRGTFDAQALHDDMLSVDDLVKALKRVISLPIVAAGGLMTGGDIRRIIQMGAVAAQMGTAFLGTIESGASTAHRQALGTNMAQAKSTRTVFTRAFSGRLARGLENQFIKKMADKTYLPFPIQNTLTGPLRQWAVKANQADYQSLWLGSEYQRARIGSVADVMKLLTQEYQTALRSEGI